VFSSLCVLKKIEDRSEKNMYSIYDSR